VSSIHILVLSIVCLVLGTLLLLFERGDAMATVLITTGVGGISANAIAANRNAKASERRAQNAQTETQMLRLDKLRQESPRE
jgi:hypothetical protein